jgi:DNA-directed RNA polymerase specialized sigma24 family protein
MEGIRSVRSRPFLRSLGPRNRLPQGTQGLWSDVLEAERQALRSCLARVSTYGRQLLTLRYEESLPLSQLAERVGRTEEAVHKALVRVRAALGKCVDLSVRASEGAK